MLKLEIFLLFALFTVSHVSFAQEDDAADEEVTPEEDDAEVDSESIDVEETEEEDSDEDKMTCFSCNVTDDCNHEQHQDNGTSLECEMSQHCWTMKTEDDGDETYRRYCGEECTDDSRELDCRSSNNQTECVKCCSDSFCNNDLLGGAGKLHGPFVLSLFVALVTYQIILS